MSCWPLRSIGSICEVNPRLPRGHGIADDRIVSFVPMAAVDEICGTIRDSQTRPFVEVKKGYTHFRSGDVLFAKITPCMENGKAAIASDLVSGLGFGSTEFHVLRAKDEVLPEWLFYFVRRPTFRNEAKRNFTGTAGQQRVPATFLSSAAIPVPLLPEQRRIVDLLSRAEGIVRLRREAEKKAAELIPALFLDMFGDPVTNPKGWPVAPISNICDKCSTIDPRKTPEVGFSYIDIAAIDNDKGIIAHSKALLGADSPSRARQVVKAGDVIFSTVRPNLRGSAMVPDDLDGQICSTGFCVLRPKTAITSAFVYSLVRSSWFVAEMMKKVRGAQYPAVTDKDLFGHSIPTPPMEIQQQFSARFDEIVAIKSQQGVATAKAQATFDALLAGVFDGRGRN